MGLRYDEVADLVRIIDASACDEFVLETPELKLVVRRSGTGAQREAGPAPATPSAPVAREGRPSPEPAAAPQASVPPSPAGSEASAGELQIRAPMVGTFYRAPAPEDPPFVEAGSIVEAGQAIGIIEVMKLFTTLYAERAGRVKSVEAENGSLVEYGQLLFVMEDTG